MDGLLDFVKTPAGQGLLAAAFGGLASAGRGGPINTLGAAGLSGVAGYSAANANALKAQKAQLLQLQRDTLPTLYGKDADGNPTFDYKTALQVGATPEDIMKLAQMPNAAMSKVARTIEVPGANGSKQTMQYDEYGRPVGQAVDSYVAPQLVDQGGMKQFVVPTAGQAFNVTMSPSEQAANARGWANIRALDDANNINKEAQRMQIFTGPDGNTYRVDKGTGQATPVVTQNGMPFQDGTASKLTEAEGKNTLYLSQMRDASNTFDKIGASVSPARVALTNSQYTNMFAGAEAQKVAQTQRQWAESYLRAKTGAAATADEVDNNIRTFFPVVGDSPEVIQQKIEARRQTEQDMRIPAGRGADKLSPRNHAQPSQAASMPQVRVLRTGRDASGRRVVQYSDGSIGYGD
ncbi:hypothetical protein KVG96_14515 [Pseudomonas sp. COR58]|uniref:Uncharacterized protein n=1 Tax=Pseudomonas ekonensis TaxID=2842353 RepID=A0ABS6PFC3_9PSED|nr:hypothetical protein [Pseudomonas ekonensis]MBV4459170.1 hypothetical protein [Pseudomonas ekonensis]